MPADQPRRRRVRQPSVSDEQIVRLVASGKGAWRYTALAALVAEIGGIGVDRAGHRLYEVRKKGLITSDRGRYSIPQPVGEALEPTVKPPKYPPPRRSDAEFNNHAAQLHHRINRYQMLLLLDGRVWRWHEILELLQAEFGCGKSAVLHNLSMARSYGYIKRQNHTYFLTGLAKEQLARYGQLEGDEGFRFAMFCGGRPGLKFNRRGDRRAHRFQHPYRRDPRDLDDTPSSDPSKIGSVGLP